MLSLSKGIRLPSVLRIHTVLLRQMDFIVHYHLQSAVFSEKINCAKSILVKVTSEIEQ